MKFGKCLRHIIKRKKMRLVFLHLYGLLILFPAGIQAQNLFVKGQITDAETKKPLASVSINNSTISDKQGNYVITITDKKKKMTFSIIGYESITRNLDDAADTLVLNVKLVKKAIELNTVDVISSGIDTVFGHKKFSVADYEVARCRR